MCIQPRLASSEAKSEPLDDDTEEFLPSLPADYKMRSLKF